MSTTALTNYNVVSIENYKKLYNHFSMMYHAIFHSRDGLNKYWKKWLQDNGIDNEIIVTANGYINGEANFMTFNRFIGTMQLISQIKQGDVKLEQLQQEMKTQDPFTYVEYTFIADTEFDEIELPLKLYELKVNKDTLTQRLKEKLRERHNIPIDDNIYVYDVWKRKAHRELRDNDCCQDYNRQHDDWVVYHKKKINVIDTHLVLNENQKQQNIDIPEPFGLVKEKFIVSSVIPNTAKQGMFDDEYTAILFPLLLNVYKGRTQIGMQELYKRLCKITLPFIVNQDLKQKLDLSLNVTPSLLNLIVFGFIRKRFEQEYELIIPSELKIMVMTFTQFDVPKDVPFKIQGFAGFNWPPVGDDIFVDKEKLFDLDRINVKFQIQWNDKMNVNGDCWNYLNRSSVTIDSFDESIPCPVSVDKFPA